MADRLTHFEQLLSSNLLEAELRATFARERMPFDANLVAGISWIIPNRTLSTEFASVLSAGYVRGADLWHLAAALFFRSVFGELWFLTLDKRQQEVARLLGFQVNE